MPTPFSHLVANIRFLTDPSVPQAIRQQLNNQRPAYLLGSVVADARLENIEDTRKETHFYKYTEPMNDHPWRLMLKQNPTLMKPKSDAHLAFIAGYVAHLAMDEIWTLHMLAPHFADSNWGESLQSRFFVLHFMLIGMDERDLEALPGWVADDLCKAKPNNWLPFMPQHIVKSWQTLIYDQIKPGGESKTLEVFGARLNKTPDEMRTYMNDHEWLQQSLWLNVPPQVLMDVEAKMYTHARDSLIQYMQATY